MSVESDLRFKKLFDKAIQGYSLQDPNQILNQSGMLCEPSVQQNCINLQHEVNFNTYINSHEFKQNMRNKNMDQLILKGIPYTFKNTIYQKIISKLQSPQITIKEENAEDILRDINRCFPNSYFLNSESGLYLLFDVLLKSCITYTQPLVRLVAYLIMQTGLDAYTLVPKFIHHHSIFTNPSESKLYVFQVIELLQKENFELSEAFEYTPFVLPWIISCFTNCLSFNHWERFFDCFMYFGTDFLVSSSCQMLLYAGEGTIFKPKSSDEMSILEEFEVFQSQQNGKLSILGMPESYAFEEIKGIGKKIVNIDEFLEKSYILMLKLKQQ